MFQNRTFALAQSSVNEPYPLIIADGGRAQSKRPRQSNDCGVVAIAIACQLPYDTVYDDLVRMEVRSCGTGTDTKSFMHQLRWLEIDYHGYEFEWLAFPAVKGQERMHPNTFCQAYPKGTFICKVSHHVFAVVDGVVHDHSRTWPCRCVYGAWKVTKKQETVQ